MALEYSRLRPYLGGVLSPTNGTLKNFEGSHQSDRVTLICGVLIQCTIICPKGGQVQSTSSNQNVFTLEPPGPRFFLK